MHGQRQLPEIDLSCWMPRARLICTPEAWLHKYIYICECEIRKNKSCAFIMCLNCFAMFTGVLFKVQPNSCFIDQLSQLFRKKSKSSIQQRLN